MKNVCAPAVVIGDQIIIVGGKGSVSPSLSLPLPRSLGFCSLGVLPQKAPRSWEGKEEGAHPPCTSLMESHGD